MQRSCLLLLLSLGCTPRPIPGPPTAAPPTADHDAWSMLADGELEPARALFSSQYKAGDKASLGGLIRIAHICGKTNILKELLTRVGSAAPPRTLLAAGLAVTGLGVVTPTQLTIAKRACALRQDAKFEVRASTICSRLALRAAAQKQRHCTEGCDETTVVPMSLVGPSPVVMASVNGKPPMPFLVDSGASTSVLTKRYAASIGVAPIPSAHYRVNSPGGLISADRALASLKVGSVHLANVPFAIIDLPFGNIAGLISPHDAYGAFRTRFDFRAFTFTIAPSKKRDEPKLASLPLRIAEGNPHIWVAFGKRPSRPLTLDTGAVNTTLTLALAKLGDKIPLRGESRLAAAGGKSAKSWQTTATLEARAGELQWKTVRPVLFSPVHAEDYDAFRKFGLLGMDFLMGRILEFDGPAGVIRISRESQLTKWNVGTKMVSEILGKPTKTRPVTVVEKVIAREGGNVELEVQLVGVKKPSTFRIRIRDNWHARGTWLVARPVDYLARRQGDGSWKEAPKAEVMAEWMKVFVPFKTEGKNLKVNMVTVRRGNETMACTMMAMDAESKAGPARFRSWECPSEPWRVVKLELVKKSDGKMLWGFRQRGVR
ncbi:MAG: aspartyl protease family protein [Deltaproteobacteria bacterium]|nr:aspartyl protease family protein [Deltaproteobacteria bacterium]